MIDELINLLLDRIHQGLNLNALWFGIADRVAAHPVERLALQHRLHQGATDALQNDARSAIGQFDELIETCDHADRRQLLRLAAFICLDFAFGYKN